MLKWTIVLVSFISAPSFSQESPFQSKDQVRVLAEGKQWTQRLISDGSITQWTIKSNGNLYATYKGGGARNQSATFVEHGTWEINEAGQFCVQWQGSKWPSPDQCLSVGGQSDALRLFVDKDGSQAYADLTIE